MTYRKAVKIPIFNRIEEKKKIREMADLILDGEEDALEEYDGVVKNFVKITKGVTPAFETDPVMYKDLVEMWGEDPGKTLSTNDQLRYLNYLEMVYFLRGYKR